MFDQSVVDLAALRITGELLGERYVLPAAGLPWFMTLFGRDTLITSLQTLWVGPGLARGALHLLGALQGTRVDDFRDEEPGQDHARGPERRADAARREAAQPVLRHRRRDAALADPALGVLAAHRRRRSSSRRAGATSSPRSTGSTEYGDRDGDGYVEYQTRSSQGLGNQCWKDSWDGIQFSDGTIPPLPIATAEIQGYVYDAKRRIAELARRLDARRRRSRSAWSARRTSCTSGSSEDFWSDERGGYYVVGLDGDKRPIDSHDLEHGPPALVGHRPGGARAASSPAT